MRKRRSLGKLKKRAFRTNTETEPLYREIAEQIVLQRVNRDISQSELAELCGTTQSAIARVERGDRPPRIDTLMGIANALDCELIVSLRPRTIIKKGRRKK